MQDEVLEIYRNFRLFPFENIDTLLTDTHIYTCIIYRCIYTPVYYINMKDDYYSNNIHNG